MQTGLEPMMYIVVVVRSDVSLAFFETDTLEQAKEAQKALNDEWINSVKEQRPFFLPSIVDTGFDTPVLTSFSPNLLREIKISKMSLSDYERSKNPYERQVQQGGLSEFMNRNFQQRPRN